MNLELIGKILYKRAENIEDDIIRSYLGTSGYSPEEIENSFSALDEDVILTIKSIPYLTPLFPVTYKIGIHKIEKKIDILNGIMKRTFEIAIRTVDKVSINRNIISADISISHAEEGMISINAIYPKDANKIEKLYSYIIDSQRRSIVNISED